MTQRKKYIPPITTDSFLKGNDFKFEVSFISILNKHVKIGQHGIKFINTNNNNYFSHAISKLIEELNIEWSKKNLPSLDYYLATFIIWASHNISEFLLEDEKKNLFFVAERFLYGFFPTENRIQARTFVINALDLSWKIAWNRACKTYNVVNKPKKVKLISSFVMAKHNQKNKILETLNECNLLFSCVEYGIKNTEQKLFVKYEHC